MARVPSEWFKWQEPADDIERYFYPRNKEFHMIQIKNINVLNISYCLQLPLYQGPVNFPFFIFMLTPGHKVQIFTHTIVQL